MSQGRRAHDSGRRKGEGGMAKRMEQKERAFSSVE
jgi:hypothetical protein